MDIYYKTQYFEDEKEELRNLCMVLPPNINSVSSTKRMYLFRLLHELNLHYLHSVLTRYMVLETMISW